MGAPLTKQQHKEIIECYNQGHTIAQTAELTGHSAMTVALVLDKYDAYRKYPRIRCNIQDVIKYYYTVIDLDKTAKKFSLGVSQIRKILNDNDVPTPRQVHNQEVEEKVKELFHAGCTYQEIADEIKLSKTSVGNIISRLVKQKRLYD